MRRLTGAVVATAAMGVGGFSALAAAAKPGANKHPVAAAIAVPAAPAPVAVPAQPAPAPQPAPVAPQPTIAPPVASSGGS
jgi:hypothetical protein